MPQILVENLKKSFKVAVRRSGFLPSVGSLFKREHRVVRALRGISFNIESAELVGYIGPNGAGKSTTIKIISGILVPDSGRCEVLGRSPWQQRIEHVRRIGVVFGQRSQLWWDVPVADSFELLRDIYKVPRGTFLRNRDELVAALGLESLLDVPVRQLSLGQKMRCELAASLLHQPPILFLDEPTIGLDAVSKLAVRDFIRCINRERGVTVILTTHDMDDIEALCTRIMLIGRGCILMDGSLSQLRNNVAPERILKLDFVNPPALPAIPGVQLIKNHSNQAEFRFDPGRISAQALIRRLSECTEIKDFMIENPPIEEIVAKMYGDFKI